MWNPVAEQTGRNRTGQINIFIVLKSHGNKTGTEHHDIRLYSSREHKELRGISRQYTGEQD